jgi:hypothetical protein
VTPLQKVLPQLLSSSNIRCQCLAINPGNSTSRRALDRVRSDDEGLDSGVNIQLDVESAHIVLGSGETNFSNS